MHSHVKNLCSQRKAAFLCNASATHTGDSCMPLRPRRSPPDRRRNRRLRWGGNLHPLDPPFEYFSLIGGKNSAKGTSGVARYVRLPKEKEGSPPLVAGSDRYGLRSSSRVPNL